MMEYLIYIGAAILVLAAFHPIGTIAKRYRPSKGAHTVEELQIAVKVDADEAMDQLRALCDEARQLQDLIDGRTVQSLATVALSPDDTVVLMTDKSLTPQQRDSITVNVKGRLPDGVKVLVLDGGFKIAALTKASPTIPQPDRPIPHIPQPSPA